MYRAPSRFNVALILAALVLVMILLGGCVASAPPTPTPTWPKPPCDPPASDRDGIVTDAAIQYIQSRCPEQNLPSDHFPSGDWTLNRECPGSRCRVIVSNELTGFRWEGDVYWSGGMDYTVCHYTPEKVESVSEYTVTLPASIPNR
jgi:hypothetical protein